MRKKAFTLIELIMVIVIVIIGGSLLFGGCSWIMGGCSGQEGSLITNPFHNSTATIKVIRSYAMAANDEVSGNVYRIYAKVLEDSDGNDGEETFEVRDSWLDGNMSSADLFGKMVDDGTFKVKCRGERSGLASAFRGITGVETIDSE